MDTQHLKDGLIAAHTALVERIEKQPYLPFNLQLNNNGTWVVGRAYLDRGMREYLSGPHCDTPEEALAGIMEVIRKLPSEAESNLLTFQRKVAEVIDFGNEHGIEMQWLNPLVETARALASNALPPAEGAA